MSSPLISVIVPIYKSESYMHRCVDSLLVQTFKDFEILLIDDGSPDKSGNICDEYAQMNDRIRVFHKNNGGVSSARQYGMDKSLGEYIIHADPDDWVEPTMLEELYARAKESDADMVICDYYEEYYNSKKSKYVKQEPSVLDHNVVLKEMFEYLHGSCWNKLVKKSCFNKFSISFPMHLSHCEDLYVNILLLLNNIKIAYQPKAYYHYVKGVNENSLTFCYNELTYKHDLYKKELFCEILKNHEMYDQAEQFFIYSLVKRAFLGNVFSSKQFRKNTYIYKDSILRKEDVPLLFKIFLYCSCVGMYKPCKFLYLKLMKLKSFVKK